MAARTSVDVGEELLPFFRRYAPQRNHVRADAVQVAFLHAVELGLAGYAFRFSIVLGEGPRREVVLELSDPAGGLGHLKGSRNLEHLW